MKQYKFKFNLHKTYFEKGYSLTNYVKYLIALFGLSSLNVKATLIMGFIYAVCCYFIGLIWLKFGWYEAEIEVSNYFNKFVQEMRKTYKNRKI